MYESEEYKIECWRAGAYGIRLLANALPFAVTIAALAFLIQSIFSQPFTLSCKSEPIHTTAKAVINEPKLKESVNEDQIETEAAPKEESSVIFQRKEPY